MLLCTHFLLHLFAIFFAMVWSWGPLICLLVQCDILFHSALAAEGDRLGALVPVTCLRSLKFLGVVLH